MRWTGFVIIALYVLSIPWYRTPGDSPGMILGMPDWVAVAIACYVAAAGLTAVAWLRTRFDDGDAER